MEGLAVLVMGLVVGPLLLGLDDGDAVGEAEGGIVVGEKLLDGLALGLFEGSMKGGTVGALVVFVVGISISAFFFVGRLVIFSDGKQELAKVGVTDAMQDGAEVGLLLGLDVDGFLVGFMVGPVLGRIEVGMLVDPVEGLVVLGLVVGLLPGLDDGDAVGEAEGGIVVGEKLLDGLALGLFEGREDGFFVGDLVEDTDGSKLGTSVGSMEGGTVGVNVDFCAVFLVGVEVPFTVGR